MVESEALIEKPVLRAADRLIVALDVDGADQAETLVKTLVPLGISHFKVGLSLFTQVGPDAIEVVHRNGGNVFLDLKFHDIPNTVARSVRAATGLGVWMMNLHIQGGSGMMRQAAAEVKAEARRRSRKPPILVGVTVLTSMAQKDLMDLGLRKPLKDQVLYLAKLAKTAGLDGIVASAQEAKVIRWACGEEFIIVTPGIRPNGPETDPFSLGVSVGKDDQQRTATPHGAIEAGANYLVVGRPILEAKDPKQVAEQIVKEIEGA